MNICTNIRGSKILVWKKKSQTNRKLSVHTIYHKSFTWNVRSFTWPIYTYICIKFWYASYAFTWEKYEFSFIRIIAWKYVCLKIVFEFISIILYNGLNNFIVDVPLFHNKIEMKLYQLLLRFLAIIKFKTKQNKIYERNLAYSYVPVWGINFL